MQSLVRRLSPRIRPCIAVGIVLILAGCSTVRRPAPVENTGRTTGRNGSSSFPALPPAGSGRGAYYQDDGPGDTPPADLLAIPDAEPRIEPYLARANRPYAIFGKTYAPITDNVPLKQRGIGSWYGKKFHGQRTSSGELYDMYKMTAAHPTLPIPSYARVTNLKNGRQVIVRINDRGPFHSSRIIDVSYTAAFKLGYLGYGSSELEVERLLPEDIAQMHNPGRAPPVAAESALSGIPPNRQPATASPVPTLLPPTAARDTAPLLSATAQTPVAGQSLEEFLKARGSTSVSLQPVLVGQADPGEFMQAPQSGQAFWQPTVADTVLTATASGFYLQFGAFSQSTNAEATRERLLQHWPQSLPTLEIRQNGNLYRLYSGPFDSRGAAAEAATLSANPIAKPTIVQP